jgi:hypothetical protein
METIIEQYLNSICCGGNTCTTFRINGQCLLINSNHLIIN